MNKKIETLFIEKNFTTLKKPIFLWVIQPNLIQSILKLFFLKVTFFKNRNSDSFILLKSIVFTMVILPLMFLFFCLFIHSLVSFYSMGSLEFSSSSKLAVGDIFNFISESPRNVAVLWITALSIVYWNLRSKFAGQWMYCADLYNKISYLSIDTKNPREILYQRCTLALDLIQTDLHTHKSFSKTFNVVLEKSIYYRHKFYPETLLELPEAQSFWANYKCLLTPELEIERFKNGQASTEQAYNYISMLQNDLDNLLTEECSEEIIKGGADYIEPVKINNSKNLSEG